MADAALQRVHRAASFIEVRLFAPIALQDVVEVAGGSLSELHRLFTSVYGVSLASYVRWRRLSEAARMLRKTTLGVLDIALRCQYQSQAAFSRAFRRQFGEAPGRFRKRAKSAYLEADAATLRSLEHRRQLNTDPELVWRHTDRALRGIVGHANIDSLDDFRAQQRLLAARLGTVAAECEVVGIAGETQADGRLHFFLGTDAEQIQQEQNAWAEESLAAGLYAVFSHFGPADHVRDSIAYFAQTWTPDASMTLADGPSAEVFRLRDASAPSLRVEIWVPVTVSS